MFQRRLHDENAEARLVHPGGSKDVLMSAKKTAFSDVKNLLSTNTPNAPSKSNLPGLKKPVFGSKFKANNENKCNPIETKGAAPSRTLGTKNFKPRFDLASIDYSDNEPHLVCNASSGKKDIMYDFWSTSTRFEIYQEDPAPTLIPDDLKCPPIKVPEYKWEVPELPPFPELDDILPPSFQSISFDDL